MRLFLMYVDESGDIGMGTGASDFFILSALVIHEMAWFDTMLAISNMRAQLYGRYGFESKDEIHAEKLLGRSKGEAPSMSRLSRILMLRDVIRFEATLVDSVRLINVVVDKRNKGFGYDVFTVAWNTLINRFENTIRYGNFPTPRPETATQEKGFIIVDETDQKKLLALVRQMRWDNSVPSRIYPGTVTTSNLRCVIEDPMHKQSDLSLPIQLCDVNAYFLKQAISPNGTVKKHKAQNYFYYLEPILLKQASNSNQYGIVWR